jgi:selenocysteine lyase/cysteine desulfurase
MVEHHMDYDRKAWEPAESARRFECGSPNMMGIHALEASLALLEEVGSDQVAKRLLARSAHLIQVIGASKRLQLVTPPVPGRYAGIVSFRLRGADQAQLHRHLMDGGVACALRGDAIRFSPHFYTPRKKLEQALDRVLAFA